MFEKASRLKIRFNSKKGILNVEDLWDLPLISRAGECLDNIAKSLNREIKENQEESFVVQVSKENEILKLKFDIIKHIIDVRLAEKQTAENMAEKKEKKEKILAIIADKEDEALKNMSSDELKKMVNEL